MYQVPLFYWYYYAPISIPWVLPELEVLQYDRYNYSLNAGLPNWSICPCLLCLLSLFITGLSLWLCWDVLSILVSVSWSYLLWARPRLCLCGVAALLFVERDEKLRIIRIFYEAMLTIWGFSNEPTDHFISPSLLFIAFSTRQRFQFVHFERHWSWRPP